MVSVVEEKQIDIKCQELVVKCSYLHRSKHAFTLVELLVVVAIISILMGILLPVLGKVRQQAKTMIGINNQKQIVYAANFFAFDNDDRYPESVATVGLTGGRWRWQEPTMLTGYNRRSSQTHRSISTYLQGYISNATIMFCPNAPSEYKYLQQVWEAGDAWDNPDTNPLPDPVFGTYCFYWNYTGFLVGKPSPFKGPRSTSSSRKYSKLLCSDYYGYDQYQPST